MNFGRGLAWLDTGTHDSLVEEGPFFSLLKIERDSKLPVLKKLIVVMAGSVWEI